MNNNHKETQEDFGLTDTTERKCSTCAYTNSSPAADPCRSCWSIKEGPRFPRYVPIIPVAKEPEPLPKSYPYAPNEPSKALDVQVGGDHYKSMPIQPIEFSIKNNLNACQANAIKYIARKKGDKAKRTEDLRKAIHVIELYIGFIEDGTLAD